VLRAETRFKVSKLEKPTTFLQSPVPSWEIKSPARPKTASWSEGECSSENCRQRASYFLFSESV